MDMIIMTFMKTSIWLVVWYMLSKVLPLFQSENTDTLSSIAIPFNVNASTASMDIHSDTDNAHAFSIRYVRAIIDLLTDRLRKQKVLRLITSTIFTHSLR